VNGKIAWSVIAHALNLLRGEIENIAWIPCCSLSDDPSFVCVHTSQRQGGSLNVNRLRIMRGSPKSLQFWMIYPQSAVFPMRINVFQRNCRPYRRKPILPMQLLTSLNIPSWLMIRGTSEWQTQLTHSVHWPERIALVFLECDGRPSWCTESQLIWFLMRRYSVFSGCSRHCLMVCGVVEKKPRLLANPYYLLLSSSGNLFLVCWST
jgi:hypothetical protein